MRGFYKQALTPICTPSIGCWRGREGRGGKGGREGKEMREEKKGNEAILESKERGKGGK